MFAAQISRTDRDEFTAIPIANQDELAASVRPYLTSLEARSLGLDPVNDADDHKPAFLTAILTGLGASASTTILFTVIGFLATLGLPSAAGAVAPVASSLF